MTHAKSSESGWQLPGTGILWSLPLVLPWLSLFQASPAPRVSAILQSGTALAAVWLAIGLWAAWKTRHQAHNRVRRTVLRAFPATACAIAAVTVWSAAGSQSDLGSWISLAPILMWLLCTFFIPFWTDDPDLLQPREPVSGWMRLLGFRMAYYDPQDPVLWVRMRNQIPFREGIGYTPNFGHIWGRLAFLMLPAAALSSVALIVASL